MSTCEVCLDQSSNFEILGREIGVSYTRVSVDVYVYHSNDMIQNSHLTNAWLSSAEHCKNDRSGCSCTWEFVNIFPKPLIDHIGISKIETGRVVVSGKEVWVFSNVVLFWNTIVVVQVVECFIHFCISVVKKLMSQNHFRLDSKTQIGSYVHNCMMPQHIWLLYQHIHSHGYWHLMYKMFH